MTFRIVCPLIALTASLAGCTSTAPSYIEPAAQPTLVQQERTVLVLQSLGGAGRKRLRELIASASHGRRDALHLDLAGPPQLGAEIASEARAMGVAPYNIRLYGPLVIRRDRLAARIEATTYEAYPPACPSMSIVGPSTNDNSFDPTLGCSIRNNLAIVVNDPSDLIDNHTVMPSDGNRAAIPVANYRSFGTINNRSLGQAASTKSSSDLTSVGTTAVQPSQ